MLRTTACMTQQHRLLTIIIIIKTLEKYSELYPIHSDFSFVRKWHKQLKKIASMEVCQEGLTSGNLLEKTTGWAETRMSGRWFPYVQVRGGLGFILQVIAAKPEHPKLTLEKLPSLNGLILHGWTTVLHSQKNQTVFKLENLSFLSRKVIHQKLPRSVAWLPSQADSILPAGVGDGVGDGTSPGNQKKSYRRPYCSWRACGLLPSLQCYDLWRWDACLIWRYMLCTQNYQTWFWTQRSLVSEWTSLKK